MSPLREHLRGLHERLAAHHVAEAKHHAVLHKYYRSLVESAAKADLGNGDDADVKECMSKIADARKAAVDHHADESSFHIGMAKTLGETTKAAGVADDDERDFLKIQSDGVKLFDDSPARIRAIPRAGQQPLDDFSTTAVDPDFQSFIKAE